MVPSKKVKEPRNPKERCAICGCALRRGEGYGKPTPEGRSHATKHHYVAERFYGRSRNRRGPQRNPIFRKPAWRLREETDVFCYECHEELLHNPVFLPEDIRQFANVVKARKLNERRKGEKRHRIARRVRLLNEIIKAGLEQTASSSR